MKKIVSIVALFAVVFTFSGAAQAEGIEDLKREIKEMRQEYGAKIQKLQARVEELEAQQKKQVEVVSEVEGLKEDLRKTKLEIAIPKLEYKSYSGLGPAASKVYYVPRGLSIGGYGEAIYENYLHSDKTDRGDTLRFVPYLGYKFSDNIIMNTELEIEHAGIKNISERNPEVYVEFMYLDFLLNPKFNLRPGLFLVPASRMNEYHEPTTYYGVLRPDVERNIIPSVWRELGVMSYGELMKGLSYKVALMNGLRTDQISDWIGGGRQRGAEANFNKPATIGRLDFEPIKNLNIGGFAYYGEGENQGGAATRGGQRAQFQLYGLESQYQWKNLWLKGLLAVGKADGNANYKYEAASTNRSKEVYGWYLESAYNIMPHIKPDSLMSLSPFLRYEQYDLHRKVFAGKSRDKTKDREVLTLGLDFKPHPQVVIKADYQRRDTDSTLSEGKTSGRDENKIDQVNVGMGFIF